jgi:hypothetical protein
MDDQPRKELAFKYLEHIMLDILCGLRKREGKSFQGKINRWYHTTYPPEQTKYLL